MAVFSGWHRLGSKPLTLVIHGAVERDRAILHGKRKPCPGGRATGRGPSASAEDGEAIAFPWGAKQKSGPRWRSQLLVVHPPQWSIRLRPLGV